MRRKKKAEPRFFHFRVFTFGSDEELIDSFGSLERAEEEWNAVRDQFLQRWHLWGMPQAWWRFEPHVPDNLRTGPHLIITEADADEWRAIDQARRRYLVGLGIDPVPEIGRFRAR